MASLLEASPTQLYIPRLVSFILTLWNQRLLKSMPEIINVRLKVCFIRQSRVKLQYILCIVKQLYTPQAVGCSKSEIHSTYHS